MIKKLMLKWRKKRLKKLMKDADFLLLGIERMMKEQKWSRTERKQFWRDFIKSPKSREYIFSDILKLLS